MRWWALLSAAGFNAWKNKFNRYVKKGEKGIQIIAPAPIKEVEEREKIDKDTGLAVLNENGEPEMERVEYVVPRFRVTTVFDVSQTDGEPIPSLEVNELTASVKDYALLTAAIEQVSPVPMRFDEIEGDGCACSAEHPEAAAAERAAVQRAGTGVV